MVHKPIRCEIKSIWHAFCGLLKWLTSLNTGSDSTPPSPGVEPMYYPFHSVNESIPLENILDNPVQDWLVSMVSLAFGNRIRKMAAHFIFLHWGDWGDLGKSVYTTIYHSWEKFGVIWFFHNWHRQVKCWILTIFPLILHNFANQEKWPLHPV